MIEIILLIFLTQKMGNLAEQKGLRKGWWKFYTIMAWISFEILGILISVSIVQNLLLNMFFGIFCAFGGYLLLKSRLEKMPDKGSLKKQS